MVKENYSYPLLPDWSTEEIIIACEFYAEVEKYNTNGVNREKFLEKYQDFLLIFQDQHVFFAYFYLLSKLLLIISNSFIAGIPSYFPFK